MGIRIHRNTWSAPLQLIDSWLPTIHQPTVAGRALSRVTSRFVNAGWLQRQASNDPLASTPQRGKYPPSASAGAAPQQLQIASRVRRSEVVDSRVRLSGRLVDVCAELERLAAGDTAQPSEKG